MSDLQLIALEGALDLATVASLRARFAAALGNGAGPTVLDLSQVSFIDSSSLGAILEGERLVRSHGHRLAVVAPRGTAASSLLTLTGVRRRLAVFETRGAATAALAEDTAA